MTGNASLTSEVVSAVARADDVDPADVEPALFEAIDGDSLDGLFRETTGHVRFVYRGYDVTVTSDGNVSLEPLSE